jgi:histidine ammonia-lyase
MILLRANALARGVSGCRPALVETFLQMLNRDVRPVVPSLGSCGSSGDLAPLAHLGLVAVRGPEDRPDESGEAFFGGERLTGHEAMRRAGIERLVVGPKEGLAITNGAQLSTATLAMALDEAQRVLRTAEVAAAMSIEVLRGVTRAFHPAVHALRPYRGARACAANLLALVEGSALVDSMPGKVQDAYSLRCTPQVLGAVRDHVAFVGEILSVELGAVTDNPVILLDTDPTDVFSAGLFHGEPIGMAADVLKIAMCEVAALAERRLYRLTTGNLSQLPPGLAEDDRPDLGLMVPQAAAASLVSENRTLAWPSSVDSLPTCEDQEDHVAMSTTAAQRAAEVTVNTRRVVAIELLCASHGLRFRQAADPKVTLGRGTRAAFEAVIDALAGLDPGRAPAEEIARLDEVVASGEVLDAALSAVSGLFGIAESPA